MPPISSVIFWANVASTCAFLGLTGWLFSSAPSSSRFATWNDRVVMAGNATLSSSIAGTNASLNGLCATDAIRTRVAAPRLSLPPVFFSLDGVKIDGTVFCTQTATTYDAILLIAAVLMISVVFQFWRLAFSTEGVVDKSAAMSPTFTQYGSVEGAGSCLHDYTDKPDFARWAEYTLTSPLQIIIVCSTIYIRNTAQLSLASTLQGALTLCGWTVEMLIYHLEIAVHESGRFSPPFNAVLRRLCAVMCGAVYMHYVIWSTILSVYYAHEDNLRECDYGVPKLPPVIKDIVVLQFYLFSCFGVVPFCQVVYILVARPTHLWQAWPCAALVYSVLSVTSKAFLALIYVKLVTDANCVHTTKGLACLY